MRSIFPTNANLEFQGSTAQEGLVITQPNPKTTETVPLLDKSTLRHYSKKQLLQCYARLLKSDSFLNSTGERDIILFSVEPDSKTQKEQSEQGVGPFLSKWTPITPIFHTQRSCTQSVSDQKSILSTCTTKGARALLRRFDTEREQGTIVTSSCVKPAKFNAAGSGTAMKIGLNGMERRCMYDKEEPLCYRRPPLPDMSVPTQPGLVDEQNGFLNQAAYNKSSPSFQDVLEEKILPWRKKEVPMSSGVNASRPIPVPKVNFSQNQFEISFLCKNEEISSVSQDVDLSKQSPHEAFYSRVTENSAIIKEAERPKVNSFDIQHNSGESIGDMQESLGVSWLPNQHNYGTSLIDQSFLPRNDVGHEVWNRNFFSNQNKANLSGKGPVIKEGVNALINADQFKPLNTTSYHNERTVNKERGDSGRLGLFFDGKKAHEAEQMVYKLPVHLKKEPEEFPSMNPSEVLEKLRFLELKDTQNVENPFHEETLTSMNKGKGLCPGTLLTPPLHDIDLCGPNKKNSGLITNSPFFPDTMNSMQTPWSSVLKGSGASQSIQKSSSITQISALGLNSLIPLDSKFASSAPRHDFSLDFLEESFVNKFSEKPEHKFNSSGAKIPLAKEISEAEFYGVNKSNHLINLEENILNKVKSEKAYSTQAPDLPSTKAEGLKTGQDLSWLHGLDTFAFSNPCVASVSKEILSLQTSVQGKENNLKEKSSLLISQKDDPITENPHCFSHTRPFLIEQDSFLSSSTLQLNLDQCLTESRSKEKMADASSVSMQKVCRSQHNQASDELKAYCSEYTQVSNSFFPNNFIEWVALRKEWPNPDLQSIVISDTVDSRDGVEVCSNQPSLQGKRAIFKHPALFPISHILNDKIHDFLPSTSCKEVSLPDSTGNSYTDDPSVFYNLMSTPQESYDRDGALYNNTTPLSMSKKVWEYCDPAGNVQGPFSTLEMANWWKARFFPNTLLMRYDPNLPWVPLNILYPERLHTIMIPFSSINFPIVHANGEVTYPFLNASENINYKNGEATVDSAMTQGFSLNTAGDAWKESQTSFKQTNNLCSQKDAMSKKMMEDDLKALLGLSVIKTESNVKFKYSESPQKTSSHLQFNHTTAESGSSKPVTEKKNFEKSKPTRKAASAKKNQSDVMLESLGKKSDGNASSKSLLCPIGLVASNRPLLKDFFCAKDDTNAKQNAPDICKKQTAVKKEGSNDSVIKPKKGSWNIPLTKPVSTFDEIEFPEPSSLRPKNDINKHCLSRMKINSAPGHTFGKKSKKTLHEFIKGKIQTVTKPAWDRIPEVSPSDTNEPHPLDLPSLEDVAKAKFHTSKHECKQLNSTLSDHSANASHSNAGGKIFSKCSKGANRLANDSIERHVAEPKKKNVSSVAPSYGAINTKSASVDASITVSASLLALKRRRAEELLSLSHICLDSALLDHLVQLKNVDETIKFLKKNITCETFDYNAFAKQFWAVSPQLCFKVACEKEGNKESTVSSVSSNQFGSTLSKNVTSSTQNEYGWTRVVSKNSGQSAESQLGSTGRSCSKKTGSSHTAVANTSIHTTSTRPYIMDSKEKESKRFVKGKKVK